MPKKKPGAPPPCSSCGGMSTHKIGEEIRYRKLGAGIPFHNLTNYLCCTCFKLFIGDCDGYPYRDLGMCHGTLYEDDDEP